MNWPRFALSLISLDSVPHTEVLAAIARGILNAEEIACRATDGGYADRGFVQWVIDEQSERVEGFLGIAFVTLQTRIASILSSAMHIHGLLGSSPSASALMADAEKGSHGVSHIQAIWALGNYYKHRDEWNADWSTGRKDTVQVITAMGLDPRSTGNLRRGAEALGLGNDPVPYSALERLERIVDTWASDIYSTLDAKIPK